ncbi:hypothetical protein D3M70_12860 [Pseudomonas sp. LS-2]|nr:hypothetical protein D3M70_12860 [Pseudomonas sp. LS-2]
MIMSVFTGTVVKLNVDQRFGWIKYEPDNEADDDEIYFFWGDRRDELPKVGTEVTFDRKRDPEKPDAEDSYIATNVTPTKP